MRIVGEHLQQDQTPATAMAIGSFHTGIVFIHIEDPIMLKYFIAWLLGVPAFLLVIIYFFMH